MSVWKQAVPATNEQQPARQGEGRDFWATAKDRHQQLFLDYLAKEKDFTGSLEDYLMALEKASWKLSEELIKQSYANGLSRGKAKSGYARRGR